MPTSSPHTVGDLLPGGRAGCHGDDLPSERTPPRDASSAHSEGHQASCCDLQSISRRSHAYRDPPGLFPGTPTPTPAVGPGVAPSDTFDTASSGASSYHEGHDHLGTLGSHRLNNRPCPHHTNTPDLSFTEDLRPHPSLLLPRFLTPDLNLSSALVRSITAPPTTSASTMPRKLTAPYVGVDHSRSFSTAIFIVMHAHPPCLLAYEVLHRRPLQLALPLSFTTHPLPILL